LKTISNEEYYEAYTNEQYKSIISKAMSPFKIDRFEAVRIKDDALWMALQTHDPKRSKFETYLYNKVRWMCRRQVWSRSPKNKSFHNKMEVLKEMDIKKLNKSYDPISDHINKMQCEEILSTLNDDDRQLLIDRFFLSKTYKEIADKKNVSIQRIEQKIKDLLEKIKSNFINDFENSVYK